MDDEFLESIDYYDLHALIENITKGAFGSIKELRTEGSNQHGLKKEQKMSKERKQAYLNIKLPRFIEQEIYRQYREWE